MQKTITITLTNPHNQHSITLMMLDVYLYSLPLAICNLQNKILQKFTVQYLQNLKTRMVDEIVAQELQVNSSNQNTRLHNVHTQKC